MQLSPVSTAKSVVYGGSGFPSSKFLSNSGIAARAAPLTPASIGSRRKDLGAKGCNLIRHTHTRALWRCPFLKVISACLSAPLPRPVHVRADDICSYFELRH